MTLQRPEQRFSMRDVHYFSQVQHGSAAWPAQLHKMLHNRCVSIRLVITGYDNTAFNMAIFSVDKEKILL
jgi:hypothetical protein